VWRGATADGSLSPEEAAWELACQAAENHLNLPEWVKWGVVDMEATEAAVFDIYRGYPEQFCLNMSWRLQLPDAPLDVYWVAGAGADPAAWIRKAKGRIPLVHYKDFAINWKAEDVGLGSITKRYAEVGQGNINWENVAQATREAGCEWIFVEQDRTPGCAFESLKTSIDFINKLGVRF
jgi:hypothetical protein